MLALAALGCSGEPPAQGGAPPVHDATPRGLLIDTPPTAGRSCQIAADGNEVVVAFTGPVETGGVYLARSSDGGATFDKDKFVVVDAAGLIPGGVAIVGRTIYVAYQTKVDLGSASDRAARLARSTDGGETFTTVTVSNLVEVPALAVDGERVFLTEDPLSSDPNIFIRRSDDGGNSWLDPVPIDRKGFPPSISLTVQEGVLYLASYSMVYHGFQTVRSFDAGTTWTEQHGDDLVPTGPIVGTADSLLLPVIDPKDAMFTLQSNDSGASWSAQPFAVADAIGTNPVPALINRSTLAGVHLFVVGATTYAIFSQNGPDRFRPRMGFARSADRGKTWPAAEVVTVFEAQGHEWAYEPFETEYPGMALSKGSVDALLIAFFDGFHLRVLRSTDGGATWP
jgi:hypothetical protein